MARMVEVFLGNADPKSYAKRAPMPPGLTLTQAAAFADIQGLDPTTLLAEKDGFTDEQKIGVLATALDALFEVPWNGGPQTTRISVPLDGTANEREHALSEIKHIWYGQAGMTPPQSGAPPSWIAVDDSEFIPDSPDAVPPFALMVQIVLRAPTAAFLPAAEGRRRKESGEA